MNWILTNIYIENADDGMEATAKGTRSLNWETHEVDRVQNRLNTLVTLQAAIILLSVASLVNKNIAVLFLPCNYIFIDIE